MGKILDKLTLIGTTSFKPVDAFFDSGSTYCQLDEELAKEVGVIMLGRKVKQALGDDREVEAELGFAVVTIKDCNIPALFAVSPQKKYKLTIGQNVMQPYGVKLDLQKETYEIKCPVPTA
jgi:hypothetical protein